jgi:alpha-L-rhamnosidase
MLGIAALLLAAASPVAGSDGRLEIVDLRCDGVVDPLGVDSLLPRFSWKLVGSGRGLRQGAWRILVASSQGALDADRGDAWDSGQVTSDAQLNVTYAGRPLRSAERLYWKARVWGGDGHPSEWSAAATFTMGLLDSRDWHARWITSQELSGRDRFRLGYHSEEAVDPRTPKWLKLDLGAPQPVDTIRLHALRHTVQERTGFPRRLKLEVSSDSEFQGATVIADHTEADYAGEWTNQYTFEASGVVGRYVRLTVPILRVSAGVACLALSQIEVVSGGRNVAQGAEVTASDSWEYGPWGAASVVDGLGVPSADAGANATLLVRREFPVRPGLRRALAFVSGLGHYEMAVNGTRVGSQLLSPGWTEPSKTCLYDTHDVTQLLAPGANAIGLTLAGGMYSVPESGGRYSKFVGPPRPLVAIVKLRLEYGDGVIESVETDERWRTSPGPTTYAHVFGGEDHDARREPRGWERAGFDDSAWTPAVWAVGPGGTLRGLSHAAPPLGTFEEFKPVSQATLRPGVEVYDLGQNAAILPRLAVKGPAGSRVRVIPAELVNPDGSVDRRSCAHGGAPAWWQLTLAGAGQEETWSPRFFYHGARYLQVEREGAEGDATLPTLESIEGRVMHTTSEPVGDFACSNELFNRIRGLVRWAQRSNLVSVITDCPHRERLGWLEQYHLNGPSLRYEFDLERLYAKTLGDMADAQLENGLVPDIAPEYVIFDGGFRDSPEWGSALILAAWQQFVWTGDEAALRRRYDAMRRYFDYLTSRARGHILDHGLGDWYDLGPARPGPAQLTPVALTATAIYYEDALALAAIARRIGRTADAVAYEKVAAEIRAAFNGAFFDPAKGQYATGSQTANAMAYALELVPSQAAARVLEALVANVQERGNAPSAGDVGYRYLLRALAKGGRSDVVFAMNRQSDKPGYGFQLAQGATSLTEAWDGNRRSSQNHFMLGQIVEWLYADLAGLAPDPQAPGFKNVIVRPEPAGDVTWARASHLSPRGRIAVAWRKEGGRFTLDVELPPNTTATVFVPAALTDVVTEGDGPAAQAVAVRELRKEPGRVVFAIGSGRYSFGVPAN